MISIVVCTIGSKSLSVMEASVSAYAPDCQMVVNRPEPSTFGECYNAALSDAFQSADDVIVANDDVVLTPKTMALLMEDVAVLKERHGSKLGFVAASSDEVRESQSIRCHNNNMARQQLHISPVFAWLSKEAFEAAQFPPLNWYSDDVMCEDLNGLGFTHYVSRAYVHHAGSQTIGNDHARLSQEGLPWLRANRPHYISKWWGDQWL